MKRVLASFVLLVLAWPVQAHFVWFVPHQGAAVQVVFSDSLEPDGNVPISKIAQTKLFARDSNGAVDVKTTVEKDHLLATLKASAPMGVEVGGVCQYGVISKKKGDPFLLVYYGKASIGRPAADSPLGTGWSKLALEVVPIKSGSYRVLWQGKPTKDVELVALVPGSADPRDLKMKDDGTFDLGPIPAGPGLIGLRAKFVEKKAGELDDKKYAEVRHYSTWTFTVGASQAKIQPTDIKADPAATKLLADARAARANWTNFPGFSADLEANLNGKVTKGTVAVDANGKVKLTLDAEEGLKSWARREIASLVSHRLPGASRDTPCAYIDTVEQHPSGRAIRVLNDELHSSYRIHDRQITEVNRQMQDIRFTITVLKNMTNKENQFLPVSYVVNSWDLKTNALVNSSSHFDTWTRIGDFDLPVTVRVVQAKWSVSQLTSWLV